MIPSELRSSVRFRLKLLLIRVKIEMNGLLKRGVHEIRE